jgi:polyhydroxyalkanoate synthase
VFDDDPLASLTKYNVGMLDVIDDEKKLLNFLRMEKWFG